MPDQRRHRGANPEDTRAFGSEALAVLRAAVADLSWLLSKGYASPSALKVVGDRYGLTARQRTAVMRAACSDADAASRRSREVPATALGGVGLLIDGYNVLTTVEAALGGGVLLLCRDGALRDMASVHGTYRKVEETMPALRLAGDALKGVSAGECTWYLDSPVSNSGRLKAAILEAAATGGVPWRVELVHDPDPLLAGSREVVASADSVVLDRCQRWFGLARHVVNAFVAQAWVIDLG